MADLFKEGTIALVTGASSGIGRAAAIDLALNGATVIVNYNRNKEKAKETLDTIVANGGRGAIIKADVSDQEQVEEMFKKIKKHFKKIDVLINNAGIIKDSYFLMMSKNTYMDVMNTNMGGCFYCTQAAIRIMAAQKCGSIVNIASTSGIVGQEGQANYSASKGAIIAFTKSVAKEYANKNIRVNVVAPGFVSTNMTNANKDMLMSKYKEFIPQQRFGEPEEIANAITFLASDKASYITGKVLVVDGGLTM